MNGLLTVKAAQLRHRFAAIPWSAEPLGQSRFFAIPIPSHPDPEISR